MSRRTLFAALAVLGLAGPVAALSPSERLADPAQEARAREISAELRCLVCQNQSIDDSDADLAKDLRRIVRERIAAGDSNSAVKSFLVARYGEFVLLRPTFSLHNALLWLLPVFALGAGVIVARRQFGNHRPVVDGAVRELTEDERAELARLTGEDTPPRT
ncbi:MAG TPA: cytochrome c-type biogenesis protein CcmH [Beijerinckiaceae bacterium]|nr:cytochrome c-type biogenesis protein CcmH [Beijerinckiaceae bacterium]